MLFQQPFTSSQTCCKTVNHASGFVSRNACNVSLSTKPIFAGAETAALQSCGYFAMIASRPTMSSLLAVRSGRTTPFFEVTERSTCPE